jgi:hypothetical protein
MRLVGCQTEHDQIGIKTVHDMGGVWIPVWVRPLPSDPVDDFVFTFTGDRRVGYYNLEVLPSGIRAEFVADPVFEGIGQKVHERCAWGFSTGGRSRTMD